MLQNKFKVTRVARALLCTIGLLSTAVTWAQDNGASSELPAGGSTEPLIVGGDWQMFFWGGTPPVFASPGFTFDGDLCVFVTDAFTKGDQFAVYDNDVLVGTTPAVAGGSDTTSDPDVAYADPTYSSGEFAVGPGSHLITIQVIGDSLSSGGAFIRAGSCSSAAARATFEVTKDFTDGNPGEVDVTISCNTGLPIEQSQEITEGEGVKFVVVQYDEFELDCEITEDVPAGYDATYFDGTSNSSTSCEYTEVAFGAALTCEITNTPAPVDVVINKDWVFEGTTSGEGVDLRYDLTLFCDAEIVGGQQIGGQEAVEAPAGLGPICGFVLLNEEGPQGRLQIADWCKVLEGEGPGDTTHTAEVIPEFPDSSCFVVEDVFDSGVEVDNGCTSLTVSAGQGASCTVTNTVFFEGIPTLSQYGMAIMALLMLGIGLIGFRRYA